MKAIYGIRHIENGHIYVGSAVLLSRRWKYHKNRLRRGLHHSQYFQNAWNLYGEENFEWIVIENLDEKCLGLDDQQILTILEEREHFWVEYHRTNGTVYNLREVAKSNLGVKYSEESKKKMGEWQVGKVLTEETKAKISEAHKGRVSPNRGKVFSEEVRKKMSEGGKKKRLTEEHKRKICESVNGRKNSSEALANMSKAQKGHVVSEETKRKISEAQKIRLAKRKEELLKLTTL
jgi:group I intron endonuclease